MTTYKLKYGEHWTSVVFVEAENEDDALEWAEKLRVLEGGRFDSSVIMEDPEEDSYEEVSRYAWVDSKTGGEGWIGVVEVTDE